jgi:hypothetical protein
MGKILKGTPGGVEVTGEIKKALSEDQIKSFVAMQDLPPWLALLW